MADLGKEFVELDRTLHAHVESGNTFAARDCQRLIPFTRLFTSMGFATLRGASRHGLPGGGL